MRSSRWRPRSRLFSLIHLETAEIADTAQRLQRFVHWEVSSKETSHRRFSVLASP
jgi:hypothetical protein